MSLWRIHYTVTPGLPQVAVPAPRGKERALSMFKVLSRSGGSATHKALGVIARLMFRE
jgi:hypothetical protein